MIALICFFLFCLSRFALETVRNMRPSLGNRIPTTILLRCLRAHRYDNLKELGLIIYCFLQVLSVEDIARGSQVLTAVLRFDYYAYVLTKIMSPTGKSPISWTTGQLMTNKWLD